MIPFKINFRVEKIVIMNRNLRAQSHGNIVAAQFTTHTTILTLLRNADLRTTRLLRFTVVLIPTYHLSNRWRHIITD